MGIFLNPNNIDFQRAINSKIYIDKSELIKYTNNVIYTVYLCKPSETFRKINGCEYADCILQSWL